MLRQRNAYLAVAASAAASAAPFQPATMPLLPLRRWARMRRRSALPTRSRSLQVASSTAASQGPLAAPTPPTAEPAAVEKAAQLRDPLSPLPLDVRTVVAAFLAPEEWLPLTMVRARRLRPGPVNVRAPQVSKQWHAIWTGPTAQLLHVSESLTRRAAEHALMLSTLAIVAERSLAQAGPARARWDLCWAPGSDADGHDSLARRAFTCRMLHGLAVPPRQMPIAPRILGELRLEQGSLDAHLLDLLPQVGGSGPAQCGRA